MGTKTVSEVLAALAGDPPARGKGHGLQPTEAPHHPGKQGRSMDVASHQKGDQAPRPGLPSERAVPPGCSPEG